MSWRSILKTILIVVFLAGSYEVAAQEGPKLRVNWKKGLDYKAAPEPLAYDVDLDRRLEIIQVAITNEVTALDPDTGAILWKQELGEHTLLTPVAGHFLGNYRINVIVPTTLGKLFVLDGPTGKVEAQFETGYVLSLAPVVFPWTRDEEEPPYREGILLYDSSRWLRGYLVHQQRGLEPVFEVSTGSPLETLPAVGLTELDGPPPHIAFAGTDRLVTVFSGRNPGRAARRPLSQLGEPILGVTLADLDGNGRCELVLADHKAFLHALTVRNGSMEEFWPALVEDRMEPDQRRSIQSVPTRLPVALDVNGDQIDDLLLPRRKGMGLVDGKTGQSLWNPEARVMTQYIHDVNIESPPAVFKGSDGKSYAVFSDEQSICMVDLNQRNLVGRARLDRAAVVTPIVGPLTGNGPALAYARTDTDGVGVMIDLGIDFLQGSPPWLGLQSGPSRAARLPRYYHEYRTAQLDRLSQWIEETIQKAKEHAAAEEWSAALSAVSEVLATSPYHSEAHELRRNYLFHKNLVLILAASVLLLALLGYALWFSYRHGRAAIENRLAERALQKGESEKAIALLSRISRQFPKRKDYIGKLATIHLKLKRFDEESAEVYERALEAYPEEQNYIKALATAYSSIPRLDERAVEVYNEVAKIASKPGPWFFVLGKALKENERPKEALDAFRCAVINHYDDPKLPELMTELYLKLELTTPEVLPTLDRVAEQFKDNRQFLKVYCTACQEARRYDDQAQEMAKKLLEQDPEEPAAHTILATRLLQSGLHEEAMKHAEKILEIDANDPVGLRLLGGCFAAQRRLDQTAMGIFNRALEANPDAPEILVAVAHGYIQQGREDEEARAIYKRALVHNPNDEMVLRFMAGIAAREQDAELTVQTVERLLEIGQDDRDLILQLADAYCRLGITQDKAEPIYREALIHQPDQATIQENLAAIYLRASRVDSEAIQIYESVMERNPERFDIGLQLLKAYHEGDLPERALELGTQLKEVNPESTELQKLMAASSEKADQMDSAISGYEQVLAGNPEDREAVTALSSLYDRKRRHDETAVEIHRRAIQLNPGEEQYYFHAARALAGRGDWDGVIGVVKQFLSEAGERKATAIVLLESIVETAPKALKLRWFLIDLQITDGRLRDAREQIVEVVRIDHRQSEIAVKALNKILERNPKDALAYLERARYLFEMDSEKEARQSLEMAHRYHPENEEIMRELIKYYQEILRKRDSSEVRFKLGNLAMRVQDHDLAIACFQQTSRDYRWEADSIRNLAQCFIAKGMLDLALSELKRLPMEEDVKELMYDLGQRYEATSDPQGAREAYKLIFAADINYQDVKTKLEQLSSSTINVVNAERTALLNSLSEEASQRYELVQELGRGAMGIVYKAKDNELDEMVALKILPDNLIRNQEALRRFRQEARNARKLSHPNIVRIHDIGEEQGRKYISMEFVEGSDLKQKIRDLKRKVPVEDTLRYAIQVCEAMAYAHSQGIIHRDIKPANLMLTKDDQVKVTDFGIAKMVEQTNAPDSTQVGAVIGTPLYMSPEQVKGKKVDHRADIYSMGVVLYELVSGYPPFIEGDLSYQHLFTDPKPLKNVDERLANLIMKCLAKKPEDRWQSIEELLDELKKIQAEKG